MRRARVWVIMRDDDVEPEYFGGQLLCPPDGFTRDVDHAYQFTAREVARDNMVSMHFDRDRTIRIVPMYV